MGDKMKHIRLIITLCFLLLPICTSSVFAETREIIAEGTYNMGDGETPSAAEMMALESAKKIAIEQAGTYVQSYSRTKNYQLTDDEVRTVASGIMQVTVLDKQRFMIGDGFKFWVKIKALITTDNIELIAQRLKADPTIDRYGYKEIDQNHQDITTLKQQLSLAESEDGKQSIRSQIARKELIINAATLYEEGNRQRTIGDYSLAVNYYTRAIALNNNYAKAYLNRGQVYMELEQFHFAQEDFNTAIQLNSRLVLAHWYLACIYDHEGYSSQALEEYRIFAYSEPREYGDKVDIAYRRISNLERYVEQRNWENNHRYDYQTRNPQFHPPFRRR